MPEEKQKSANCHDVPKLHIGPKSRQGFIDFFNFLSENCSHIRRDFFNRGTRVKIPLLLSNGVSVDKKEINLFETYAGKDKLYFHGFRSGEHAISFATTNASIWWMKLNNIVICLDSENDIDKIKPRERVSAYRESAEDLIPIVDAEFIYKRGQGWKFKYGTNEDLERVFAEINQGINAIIPHMNKYISLIQFNDIIADKKTRREYRERATQKSKNREKRNAKRKRLMDEISYVRL